MTCETVSYSSNTYNLTISPNSVELSTVTANTYSVTIDTFTSNVVIATSGQQGPRGDSVSNAYIESSNLYIEVTDASGNYSNVFNAGSMTLDLDFIPDVTNPQQGDILQYEAATSTFVNHSLTTSRVLDIDNTNKTDGALLVYKGQTDKYTATTTLDNANTAIIGGTF